jgi:hypothetical protein
MTISLNLAVSASFPLCIVRRAEHRSGATSPSTLTFDGVVQLFAKHYGTHVRESTSAAQ